jgi:hypothetical protein
MTRSASLTQARKFLHVFNARHLVGQAIEQRGHLSGAFRQPLMIVDRHHHVKGSRPRGERHRGKGQPVIDASECRRRGGRVVANAEGMHHRDQRDGEDNREPELFGPLRQSRTLDCVRCVIGGLVEHPCATQKAGYSTHLPRISQVKAAGESVTFLSQHALHRRDEPRVGGAVERQWIPNAPSGGVDGCLPDAFFLVLIGTNERGEHRAAKALGEAAIVQPLFVPRLVQTHAI